MKDDVNICGMDLCPLCGEVKNLVINAKLRKNFPDKMITGPELCDKCKEKLTKEDRIVLFVADYDTTKNKLLGLKGSYAILPLEVLKLDTFTEQQKEFVKTERVGLCSEEFLTYLKNLENNDEEKSK